MSLLSRALLSQGLSPKDRCPGGGKKKRNGRRANVLLAFAKDLREHQPAIGFHENSLSFGLDDPDCDLMEMLLGGRPHLIYTACARQKTLHLFERGHFGAYLEHIYNVRSNMDDVFYVVC